jgi:2-dehydropantoate 2-reductase
MIPKQLKIVFIGAGAIGSLFGGSLASIKSEKYILDIILFCRKNHAEKINKNGLLIIKSNQKSVRIKNLKAYENIEQFAKSWYENERVFDFVFLTTKAYDIKKALFEYKKILNLSKYLIILQNGIGNEDIAKKFLNSNKIIRAVTSNGAYLEEAGQVAHTGKGLTRLGWAFGRFYDLQIKEDNQYEDDLNILCEVLNLSGMETIIVEDIIRECWEKIFVNIGINAFGALTRLKNGELLHYEKIKKLMEVAVVEAVNVAKHLGINLSHKNFIREMFDVAQATSDNKNSMLQDILKNKKTEIDFINGKIMDYAHELGLDVPINEILTNLIKGLEQSTI